MNARLWRRTAVAAGLVVSAAWSAGLARARAPTPTVSEPVTSGGGVSLLGPDVSSLGYGEEEYFLTGEATSYGPVGALRPDGRWEVEEVERAPFTTRMVVWKPAEPADFNGTVYVEWLNVSPGFDNPPDWLNAHNQIVRDGAAWVGVSAQAASVNGGQVIEAEGAPPAGGLKGADAVRYAALEHPGDAFSYDIFTQAGVAVGGKGEGPDPSEGYDVERVIAIGESQSAFRLTTYVNAIHPLGSVYDAYFLHSRGGESAPFGAQQLGQDDPGIPNNVRIRRDLDVPVLTLQTETDLTGLGYLPARQSDSKRFRLWEIAGTAHADAYFSMSLGDLGDGSAEAAMLDPAKASGGALSCAEPINAGAQHAAVMAGLAALDTWVRDGTPPPKGPRIETTGRGDAAMIVRDEHGIARGGIRTPIVDVPVATNDGESNAGGSMCFLFGRTVPLDAATLAALYPNGADDYLAAFDEAADDVVERGFWLEQEAEHYQAAARQLQFG